MKKLLYIFFVLLLLLSCTKKKQDVYKPLPDEPKGKIKEVLSRITPRESELKDVHYSSYDEAMAKHETPPLGRKVYDYYTTGNYQTYLMTSPTLEDYVPISANTKLVVLDKRTVRINEYNIELIQTKINNQVGWVCNVPPDQWKDLKSKAKQVKATEIAY